MPKTIVQEVCAACDRVLSVETKATPSSQPLAKYEIETIGRDTHNSFGAKLKEPRCYISFSGCPGYRSGFEGYTVPCAEIRNYRIGDRYELRASGYTRIES